MTHRIKYAICKVACIVHLLAVSIPYGWAAPQQPARLDPSDIIFGPDFRLILNDLATDSRFSSKDFQGLVETLRAIQVQAQAQEASSTDGATAPPKMTAEQTRAYLQSLRKNIDVGQAHLKAFSDKVAKGEYKEYIRPEVWTRCENELNSRIDVIHNTAPDSVAPPQPSKLSAAQSSNIQNFKTTAFANCQDQMVALSAELGARAAELQRQVDQLDTSIKAEQARLDNKSTLDDAERARLAKDIKDKQAARDQAKASQQQANDAKGGVDVWLLVSGLVMIAAGLVAVFYGGYPLGWALVSGGFAMVLQATGAGDSGSSGQQGNSSTTTSQSTPDGAPSAPAETFNAKAIDAATSVQKPSTVSANATAPPFEKPGFSPISPHNPGGNLILLLNRSEKTLIVARVDEGKEILRIDLAKAHGLGGLWPNALKVEDLIGAENWSIDTASGFVDLTLSGTFSSQQKLTFSLLEGPNGEGYQAIVEIAR